MLRGSRFPICIIAQHLNSGCCTLSTKAGAVGWVSNPCRITPSMAILYRVMWMRLLTATALQERYTEQLRRVTVSTADGVKWLPVSLCLGPPFRALVVDW